MTHKIPAGLPKTGYLPAANRKLKNPVEAGRNDDDSTSAGNTIKNLKP